MKGLSLRIIEEIEKTIGTQFDEFALRFLGIIPKLSRSKKIVFSSARTSLTSLFLQALGDRKPDKKEEEVLKILVKTSNSYLDALKHKTQANISQKVVAYSQDRTNKKKSISFKTIGNIVQQEMDKSTNHLKMIVNAETNKCINTGTALQIDKVAVSNGDDDPTVFFIIVSDDRTGPYEYILHTLPDRVTPRLWKLSEIQTGYYKNGDQYPSISGLHVNCRCKLTYLAKGMGFNKEGKTGWKGMGYDELKIQREQYGLPDVPQKISRKK